MKARYPIATFPDLTINGKLQVFVNGNKRPFRQFMSSNGVLYVKHNHKKVSLRMLMDCCEAFITLGLGERGHRLTRTGVLRLVHRYHKQCHIIPFVNKEGLYENTDDLLKMGVQVCPECGTFSPTEKRWCKCGEFLLK